MAGAVVPGETALGPVLKATPSVALPLCKLGLPLSCGFQARGGGDSGGGVVGGYRAWPAVEPSLLHTAPGLEGHTPEKAIKVLDSPASVPREFRSPSQRAVTQGRAGLSVAALGRFGEGNKG